MNVHSSFDLRRRILGSFYSACVGWLSVMLAFLVYSAIEKSLHPSTPGWLPALGLTAAISAMCIFPVWLAAFLPLYLFVPRSSVLWRWPICAGCGAVAGPLILFCFEMLTSPRAHGPDIFYVMASIAGGATSLFAALTVQKFSK
jgi:hypothetical protein